MLCIPFRKLTIMLVFIKRLIIILKLKFFVFLFSYRLLILDLTKRKKKILWYSIEGGRNNQQNDQFRRNQRESFLF